MVNNRGEQAVALPSRWFFNAGSGYVDMAVGGAIYLLFTPFLIGIVGLEGYALWLLSHVITFYLGLLDLGISQAHVRLHARHAARGQVETLRRLIASVLPPLLVAGALAASLAMALAFGPLGGWFSLPDPQESELRLLLVVLGLNLLISLPAAAFENVYEGEQRFDLRNARSVLLRLLTVSFQVLALLRGHGLLALAVIELGASVVRTAIDITVARYLVPGLLTLRSRPDRALWRRMRPFALWAFVDDVMVEGSGNLDRLLFAVLLPLSLLTPYALCVAAARLLMLAAEPVTELFFPLAAASHAREGRRGLGRLLLDGTRLAMLVATPVALLLYVTGEWLLMAWVPELAELLQPGLLQLITASHLLSVFFWVGTLILMAANRIRYVAAVTALEILLAIALMLALVPGLDVMGLALALLIANGTAGCLLLMPAACRLSGLPVTALLRQGVGRPLLCIVPAILLILMLRPWLVWQDAADVVLVAAIIALSYPPSVWLMGLTREDRKRLLDLLPCRPFRGAKRWPQGVGDP